MLKAKDMINELLYGLEVFLDVYEVFRDSSTLQMAGVRRIYRPPSLVAVAPTVSKILRITGRTDALCTGCSNAYAESC